jgi:hypothetical protein
MVLICSAVASIAALKEADSAKASCAPVFALVQPPMLHYCDRWNRTLAKTVPTQSIKKGRAVIVYAAKHEAIGHLFDNKSLLAEETNC